MDEISDTDIVAIEEDFTALDVTTVSEVSNFDISIVWEDVADTRPDHRFFEEREESSGSFGDFDQEWTDVLDLFTTLTPSPNTDSPSNSAARKLITIAELIDEIPAPTKVCEPPCWTTNRLLIAAICGIGLLAGIAIPLLL